MTHEERVNLAESLCARMVAQHPAAITVAGIYGSTAAGTDTPWSDLEMLFVVRDGTRVQPRQFRYRRTAVALVVVEEGTLETYLRDRPLAWEYWMSVLSALKVLYGSSEQVQIWLRLGHTVPVERFRDALQESLEWIIHEPHARLRSCRERGDARDISCLVAEILSHVKLSLCVLNRRWVTHSHYQGIADTFDFPLTPACYRELVPTLWSARELDEVIRVADTLVDNFWQLLADQGFELPRDYKSIDEVPL